MSGHRAPDAPAFHVFRSLLVLVAALLLAGCGGDDATEPAVRVTLAVELSGDGRGTVTSTPAGISCSADGGTCSTTFEEGTTVTLSAAAAGGDDTFEGWSGPCSGVGACSLTLAAQTTVTAAFDDVTVTTQAVGASGGTVASPDGALELVIPAGALSSDVALTVARIDPENLESGIVDPSDVESAFELGPDGLEFDGPVQVMLTIPEPEEEATLDFALPIVFVEGADGTADVLGEMRVEEGGAAGEAVLVGELGHFSKLVLMEFAPKLSDERTKMSLFAQITIEDRMPVPDMAMVGETVTLHASVLVGDLGDLKSQFGRVRSTSTAPLVASPSGQVDMDPSTIDFPKGISWFTTIDVTCQSAGEARLELEYTADMPGPGSFSVTTFSLGKPFTCVGLPMHELTIDWTGDGSGSVTSSPAGIDCASGETCMAEFEEGTMVTLTATPDDDSTFCGWTTAADNEASQEVKVTVDAPGTATACFAKKEVESTMLHLDASAVSHTFGVVPPGTQELGLLDEEGNTVGTLVVEFSGEVFVDASRNVLGFGQDGTIEVDLDSSQLPEGAPATDEITVQVEGRDNGATVDVRWQRKDAEGNVLQQAVESLQNAIFHFLAARLFLLQMITGGGFFFDFVLSLIY